jgi:aspartate aminotransferase-like enzyme
MNLRTPGPTPLPEEVKRALAQDMVNHRGPEMAALMRETTAILKDLFFTQNDLLLFTSSGTGGLEAAVVNTLSPGDRVLSISIGYFGHRFRTIAKNFGADVSPLDADWGKAVEPEQVRAALEADPRIKAVMVTQNETSTGTTNPLQSIAKVVKDAGKLLLVDGVSSIGSIPLETDAWGCDVVVTASQKSWMTPPGLAMVSVSPTAWEAYRQARMPRYYWDFDEAKKYADKGTTPWTPGLSTLYALNAAVKLMQAEGMQHVFARHKRVADYTRGRLKSMDLKLFADERYASDTVTAFVSPEGVEQKRILRRLKEEHDVVLAGGQGKYEDSMLRVGHMGFVDVPDVKAALDALEQVLSEERAAKAAPPVPR